MVKFVLNLFLIFTILGTTVHGSLLVDRSPQTPERILADIKATIETFVNEENLPPANKPTIVTPCADYNPALKKIEICYKVDNDSTKIEMRNPLQRFELDLSNLDIADTSSDINVQVYFKEFFKSNQELALDEGTIINAIRQGVQDGLNEIKAENQNLQIDATVCKFSYKHSNSQNEINCKIEGSLITFETDFFSDKIDLSIPDKKFIVFEIKKVTMETAKHLTGVKKFALSEGAESSQSIKTTGCDKILTNKEIDEDLNARLIANGLSMTKGKITPTSGDITFSNGSKSVVVSCAKQTIGAFEIILLEAKFDGVDPNLKSRTQPLLKESLYDMNAVGRAFIDDSVTLSIRMISPDNKEEMFENVDISKVQDAPQKSKEPVENGVSTQEQVDNGVSTQEQDDADVSTQKQEDADVSTQKQEDADETGDGKSQDLLSERLMRTTVKKVKISK